MLEEYTTKRKATTIIKQNFAQWGVLEKKQIIPDRVQMRKLKHSWVWVVPIWAIARCARSCSNGYTKTQLCFIWDICARFGIIYILSKTSMTRTPMARLPWLVRTRFFEPQGGSLDSPRKQIFMDILGNFSYLNMKCMLCVLIRIASPA